MGEKMSVLGLIMSFPPYLRSAMVQFPLKKLKCREGSQLCKLSQLCYYFLSSFEKEKKKIDIPSNPPPIAVWNSLTNQFWGILGPTKLG